MVKTETAPGVVNGSANTDATDGSKPLEMPAHFPPYPTTFAPSSTAYPPVFPPTNISVPPPSVTTINHIVSTMHHLNSSGAIRPPTNALAPPTFQPFPYPAATTYFQPGNPTPPATTQRAYYPP